MNTSVLMKWLLHVETNILLYVKRPIVLVYDGYESHYSPCIVIKYM